MFRGQNPKSAKATLRNALEQYIKTGSNPLLQRVEQALVHAEKMNILDSNLMQFFLFTPFTLNHPKELAEKIVVSLLEIASRVLSANSLSLIFVDGNTKGMVNPIAYNTQSAKVLETYLQMILNKTNANRRFLNNTFRDNLFLKSIKTTVQEQNRKQLVFVFFNHFVSTFKKNKVLVSCFLHALHDAADLQLLTKDEAIRILSEGFGKTITSQKELKEALNLTQKKIHLGKKSIIQLIEQSSIHANNLMELLFPQKENKQEQKSVASVDGYLVKTTTLDLTSLIPKSEFKLDVMAPRIKPDHLTQFSFLKRKADAIKREREIMNYLTRAQEERRETLEEKIARKEPGRRHSFSV